MNRFSRINTIWRKELIDTLRDRRTLIAMIVVPMVLYPALLLGSMQAVEMQMTFLHQQQYTVVVPDDDTARWLAQQIDSDPARRGDASGKTAEEVIEEAAKEDDQRAFGNRGPEPALEKPPPYIIKTLAQMLVVPTPQDNAKTPTGPETPDQQWASMIARLRAVVDLGAEAQVAVAMFDPPPGPDSVGSTRVAIYYDESDIRSDIAAKGITGVLERVNVWRAEERLGSRGLDLSFITPIAVNSDNIATPQKMASSSLGQIIPLILIIMTITGAIYPAIDLTAGERERGTLETLMVAPTPTMDLITGKFIVVTMIGILSALLNLLSIGMSVYFGGIGDLFSKGMGFVLPLSALPWIMVLLLPLAVMFSAMLLAVCSFARSFKEAQNYIVPVMMAAMIPAVVGILPGTRLEGPIVVMPVANIVALTRELFLGRFDYSAIGIVALSTSLYAGAAVAIAARLFGQEAVLFSDAGSVKTLFQRRFFRPQNAPSIAQALLITALAYTLNYYVQQSLARTEALSSGVNFLYAFGITLFVLMVVGPWAAARYMRVNPLTAFRLRPPSALGGLAALMIGLGSWALVLRWNVIQSAFFPMDPAVEQAINEQMRWIDGTPIWTILLFMAILPAVCEELFFRGYLLSGLESSLSRFWAVLIAAVAFGLFHYSAFRMIPTVSLGLVLGLLAIQFRSIWPGMLVHALHNGISICTAHPGAAGFQNWLSRIGNSQAGPSDALTVACGALVLFGICLALIAGKPNRRPVPPDMLAATSPEAS
ncbi:MAG: CPBP family intramembrane metalloprotease [Phycisphaerales bacterium]|nr:CPBP family intramembrane metalloprotease [Phycisphaerales bacterium]